MISRSLWDWVGAVFRDTVFLRFFVLGLFLGELFEGGADFCSAFFVFWGAGRGSLLLVSSAGGGEEWGALLESAHPELARPLTIPKTRAIILIIEAAIEKSLNSVREGVIVKITWEEKMSLP